MTRKKIAKSPRSRKALDGAFDVGEMFRNDRDVTRFTPEQTLHGVLLAMAVLQTSPDLKDGKLSTFHCRMISIYGREFGLHPQLAFDLFVRANLVVQAYRMDGDYSIEEIAETASSLVMTVGAPASTDSLLFALDKINDGFDAYYKDEVKLS